MTSQRAKLQIFNHQLTYKNKYSFLYKKNNDDNML